MFVELFLKIATAVFTVFGLYSFAHAIEESCFRSEKICMTVAVDSKEVAEQIDLYISEAKNAYFIQKNDRVAVMIMEELATKELTDMLEKKRIKYHIVKKSKEKEVC